MEPLKSIYSLDNRYVMPDDRVLLYWKKDLEKCYGIKCTLEEMMGAYLFVLGRLSLLLIQRGDICFPHAFLNEKRTGFKKLLSTRTIQMLLDGLSIIKTGYLHPLNGSPGKYKLEVFSLLSDDSKAPILSFLPFQSHAK